MCAGKERIATVVSRTDEQDHAPTYDEPAMLAQFTGSSYRDGHRNLLHQRTGGY